jgi:hypothetical protein
MQGKDAFSIQVSLSLNATIRSVQLLDMAGAGADIDDPAASGAHVDVVFDDNNCVARGTGPSRCFISFSTPNG